MTERYARQTVLPEVGEAGQKRLRAARVLVVGAGGLGSSVLLALAGAGVGRIEIVDHDRVDLSNLHRQPLYRMGDIGRPKVEAARDALAALNPDCVIASLAERLGPSNAGPLVAAADLVVDAADSLAVTYMLGSACQGSGKPFVSASVLGQRGYAGAFSGGAPSYRAVFPDMPTTVGSCAANGVLGTAVAVLGSLQAHMALQILLGLAPSPLGRLVSVDLATLSFGGFQFLGTPEPDEAEIPFIEPGDLVEHDMLVELRSTEEAPEPALARAVRLSPDQIVAGSLSAGAHRTVFCCATGVRAYRAARHIQRQNGAVPAVLVNCG